MNKAYKAYIFDMDGVLRCGPNAIEGAKEIVDQISKYSSPTIILTNECRYTTNQIRDDLIKMGLKIPLSWSIYTAGNSVSDFLSVRDNLDNIYILGETGLKTTLKSDSKLQDKIVDRLPRKKLSMDKDLYVVIGSQNKIKQDEIQEAAKWIRCGANIVTTCPDLADPGSKGDELISMPNHTIGILTKHIPCTTYCLGKPNPIIMRKALSILRKQDPELKQEEILFIGDSLDTDVRLAFESGVDSALVLTGNTNMSMIKNNIIRPTYIFHSVLEICDEIGKLNK